MKNDNTLLNLAALDILSEGPVGNVTGVTIALGLFLLPPVILWGLFYKLPKEFFKRHKGPTGESYYRALGLAPQTVERIKRRCEAAKAARKG